MSNKDNNTHTQCIELNGQLKEECCQQELARAERLLDQIDAVHLQVQDIRDNISLMQTAGNALNLISENLGQIRQLTRQKERYTGNENVLADLNDQINGLLMVNVLICDDTEFNGRRIFRDDTITLNGAAGLKLITAAIPEILGLDNNDIQTTLDSLSLAAKIINRQYSRIAEAMDILTSEYDKARKQIEGLLEEQRKLSLTA